MLEVYYGTPYDRHVILEESSDVRYRKRNSRSLEDPPGIGSRILRRLSSKVRDNSATNVPSHQQRGSNSGMNGAATGGGSSANAGIVSTTAGAVINAANGSTGRGSSRNGGMLALSTNGGSSNALAHYSHHQQQPLQHISASGYENQAFQGDVPKSPWRYPFRRAQHMQQHPMHMQRTLSQDSGSSIASAAAIQISPLHKHALSRMLP